MQWILFLICGALAQDPVNTAIENAQALALKKSRQEASAILIRAIETTPAPIKNRTKLIEALSSISTMFFTDKGQRLFEAAQSVAGENPDQAVNRYKEALALEDHNVLILTSLSRVQLAKQDCETARLSLQKARVIDPTAGDAAVLELGALLCLQQYELFRERYKALPVLDKTQEKQARLLMAQDLMNQKMWRRAFDILAKLSEEDPAFPEAHYYLFKAGSELGREPEAAMRKYVSLCKAVTARERKQYFLEPRLCAHIKDVEDELAKTSDDQ